MDKNRKIRQTLKPRLDILTGLLFTSRFFSLFNKICYRVPVKIDLAMWDVEVQTDVPNKVNILLRFMKILHNVNEYVFYEVANYYACGACEFSVKHVYTLSLSSWNSYKLPQHSESKCSRI